MTARSRIEFLAIGSLSVLRMLFALLLGLLATAACGQTSAGPSQTTLAFDHTATGFILDGVHSRLPCEDCHKAGLPSRGLPRSCNECHIQGGVRATTYQSPNHIPEFPGQTCRDCHNQNGWTQALMRHTTAMQSQCTRCHNGVQAPAKPATHITTTASCDACHTTGAWRPTKAMVHDATTIGRCSGCHNDSAAPGKPQLHIPTSSQCDSCHTSTVSWPSRSMDHTLVASTSCATCHSGAYLTQNAQAMSPSHIPVGTVRCDVCHKSFISFSPATTDHTSVAATPCATCHGGAYVAVNAQTKPAIHVSTTLACDSSGCHTGTVTWTGVVYAHQAADQTNCSTCHTSGPGLARPTVHIPSSAQCSVCHTMPPVGSNSYTTQFKPIKSPMDHVASGANVAVCSTCHNATYAFANANPQGAAHIPTSANCLTCHKTGFVNWTVPIANMDHTGQAGKCSTCHAGGYLSENAQAKGTTHIPTTQQCDSCHLNFVTFSPATMNHAGLAGQCSSCHSGAFQSAQAVNAQTKPATHVATNAQCDACHKSTVTWANAIYAHDASAVGVCSNCHKAGGPGLSKPATHVPTTQQCDACHANFTAFRPAFMNHTGAAGQCSTCHDGSFVFAHADKQGATHIPDSRQCDTCHTSTVVWTQRVMVHPANAPGNCSSCHSGQYLSENAQTKPATHVATIAQCDICHKSMATWASAIFAHDATAIGVCSNCHNAGGPGLSKPANHVPTARQCDSCHTNYTAFKPSQMNHTGLAGQCSTCHNATYAFANANPLGAAHIPTAAQCDSCHTSTVGWGSRSMDHTVVASTSCTTCHGGAYLSENAQAMSANHIPVGSLQCSACHKSFAAFSPAVMDHTAVVATACATCHGGAFVAANAQTKPATHVATTLDCSASGCHTGTVTWAGVTYSHQAADQTNCAGCHASGPGLTKPTPHIPTSAQCSICHTMPPIGSNSYTTRFKPIKSPMDHVTSGASVAACSSCHNATYAFANANPQGVTHIPTSANCLVCHKTGFVSWTVPIANMDHTGMAGRCATCHSGGYLSENAQAKGTNHIPTTQQCDLCHLNFIAFSPATMDHTGLAGQCSTCHSGAYLSENAQIKPVTHVATNGQCDACHKSTVTWANAIYAHDATAVGVCSNCHKAGGPGLSKPGNHVPTVLQCDTCHANFTAFKPAFMNHTGTAGQCSTCHNGSYVFAHADKQGATHIPDSRQCDICHTSSVVWTQRVMVHPATAAGNCSNCHGGQYVSENAQTKPVTHVPTSAQCDSCHKSMVTWATATFAHDATTKGLCSNCHRPGGAGLSKPATHVPTAQQCDTCHTNYVAFKPAQMNHAGLAGQCSTCHNATYAFANANPLGATHIPTNAQCDSCHTSTVGWGSRSMSHSVVASTSCSTCHSGAYLTENAQTKSASHIPNGTVQCGACHKDFAAFSPATMDHTAVVATPCATCHGGAYVAANAQTKPATHVVTALACNTSGCHASTLTWAGVNYAHQAADQTNCASCHTSGPGLTKPTPHIPTSAQCAVCHSMPPIGSNGYTTRFKPITSPMDHVASGASVAACSTCHNATYAFANANPQGVTHIPTSASCLSCHKTGFVSWTVPIANMDHTGMAGKCATCHSGGYLSENAQAKGTNHIPTTQQCDLCHLNFAAFSPATMDHTGLAGQCSTCHSGAYLAANAQMKPVTHVATNVQCDTCHKSTLTWANATYLHDATAIGVCSNCHKAGGPGLSMPTNHVPSALQCDTCHTNYAAFKPAFMNHTGTAAQCSTCHNGSYIFAHADKQGATHIPDARQCDICHTSTVVWTQRAMVHPATAAGNCSNCHSGQYLSENAQTKPVAHVPTSAQCDSCHKSMVTWATATFTHDATAIGACSNCHRAGGSGLSKPANHVPTATQCDTCHTNYVAFKPSQMNHAGLAGQCSVCHNATYAFANANPLGTTHIPTAAQCDSCHTSTVAWGSRAMNHTVVASTSCTTCHSGGYLTENAQAMSANHIPIGTVQCSACHKSFAAFSPAAMDHTAVAATACATCHGGAYVTANAQTKPATHVVTALACNTSGCHASTLTWAGVTYAHQAVDQTNCASCHTSGPGLTKPTPHIPTSAQCAVCHTMPPIGSNSYTTRFKPIKSPMDHVTSGASVAACSTCHNATYAFANANPQGVTHIPTSASCLNCHKTGFVSWTVPIANMDHTGLAGKCATCHAGGYLSENAQAKGTNHIPTTQQCDLCHLNFAAFTPATMDHTGLTGQCSTCHSGAYLSENAQTKPVTHVATNAQCDTCHKSTVTWATATYLHDGTAAGVCSNCHRAGGPGLSKPATHVPSAQQCDSCHTNFTAFKPAFMNHTGTAAQCATCHSGSYILAHADKQGATHIPDARQCDVCHTSTVVWTQRTMVHPATAAGNCSTCHGGQYISENAQTKPATHVPTSAQCDTCHKSVVTWATVTFVHDATAIGACSTCHKAGGAGLSKPANHVPAAQQCDTCHTNYVAFKPAQMNHTGLAGQCSNCHNATYAFANANPLGATHIPTTAQCDSCHTSTVAWGSRSMDHTVVASTSCTTCHSGAYLSENAQAMSANHIPIGTLQCSACHKSFAAFSPAAMDHTAVVATACATCHGGAYVAANAQTKPATHVVTALACNSSGCHTSTVTWAGVTYAHQAADQTNCASCHTSGPGLTKPTPHIPTSAQCSICHAMPPVGSNAYTTRFKPITSPMDHVASGASVAVCSTCHNATYAFANANPQGVTHIPTSANCLVCHKTGFVNWTVPIANMDHTGMAGKCATCHAGAYLSENAQAKGTTHIPTTQQCDLCHLNFGAFSPATMDHTGLGGQCSTCHSGAYLSENAQMKPVTHVATNVQCDTCHKSTLTWANAIFAHDATTIGVCSNCHKAGGPGLSKPTNHVPTALQCDTCHTNYTAFKPASMNHTGSAGQCSTCHNGSYVFAHADKQGATHIPDSRQCDTCHSSTVVWTQRLMVHPATAPGNCSSCHSGQYISENAQTKPATHVATSAQCDSCHKSMVTWATVTFTHDATVIGACSNCHRAGGPGLSKPANHVPTAQQCDTCHTNYIGFKPAQMNHAGQAGQCSICHNATYAFANANPLGATHIPTAAQCDSCHTSTVAWGSRAMNHTVVASTSCATCHSGAYLTENAQTKSVSHIPFGTVQCSACHKSFAAFSPAAMDHTAVVATACATCHGGAFVAANAQTKPATHVVTALACNSSGCHASTLTWAGVSYAHQAVDQTNCASCHTSGPGLSKPTPHIPTSAQCSICHAMPPIGSNAYTTRFKPIKSPMDHVISGASVAVCSTCHNATYAFANANPKGVTHIPTSANCLVCHKTGFVNWTVPLANMDHTGLAGKCSTCHAGGYLSENAQAKGTRHIQTTQQCDLCHVNFVAFSPATMDHTGLAGQCSTCHSGAYLSENAQMKPVTHVATNLQCDTCHKSTLTWANATYLHDAAAIGVCSNCHKAGGPGLAKPATHVPTALQCDTCHSNYTAFKPASMNHTGTAAQCATCHNGSYTLARADKQGATHIPDARQCDVCHTSTVVWTQRLMVHPATAPGNCSSCHTGQYLSENAQTKPATHVPTSAQCDSCHTSMVTWATVTFAHDATAIGACSTCHKAGGAGLSKPANHVPAAQQCDTCHTNYVAFKPSQMNHAGLAGQCSSCHNATYAFANANPVGTTHIPTAAQCDSCHTSTVGWGSRSMDHTVVASTSCTTCHGGAYLTENAQAMSASHIPTGTLQCSACHKSFVAFSPAAMDHTAVVATACATCHGGAYVAANAQTKPATHVVTALACNSSGCHASTVTWAGVSYAHQAADQTNCASCHTSGPGLTKPTPHIPTSAQCSICHAMPPIGSNAYSTRFKPVKSPMDHVTSGASVAVCSTCHNATYAFANANPKGVTHIPTNSNCLACHKTGFVNWTVPLANMDHTGMAGKCATCHAGAYLSENAQAKGTTHIPTTQQCDLCHLNFIAFSPATMDHTGLAGQCSTCHSGAYLGVNAQMKPVTHVATNAQCDTCHKSTLTWANAVFAHDATTIGVCSNCHKAGGAGLSKPSTHVPTALQCDTCHTNTTAFKPAFMNHTGTTGQCSSCHNGSYVFAHADKQGATHIPDSRQCDICHTSTVVWTQRLMVHPASAPGNCSSCHSGQYLSENAQTKPATHVATSAQCDSCHKSMVTWASATFAHDASAIGVCSNCHRAGGPGLSKPANHVPTAQQCDTCHANYTGFKPAQMNHAGLAGQCSSCHNATYAFANANPLGTTHIPTTAQCDSCHTSTVGWGSRAMNHTVVAATSCTTCHSGAYLTENAQAMSASHIPVGTIQCSACHKSFTAFSPAAMDHTAVVATACATCHGGAYVAANAQTKPATHVVTALACNASGCHTSTVTWAGVSYAHQAADQTNCASCHTSGPGLAKPTPHIPTSAQCSICHTMPPIGSNAYSTRFKPIKSPMDHVASGAGAAACSICHNATYAFANANPQGVTHIPTSSNCLVCHKTGFVSWTVPIANMDHTGMAGKCSTCHGGGYLSENAQAKGATHIPTTQQCDLCHVNFVAFAPATMDHTGLAGQCSTCHSGAYLGVNAQMKPVTHVATNLQCDTCHKSTVTWANATFAHDATTIGVCSNCHKAGGSGLSKPTNHVPTALQCDTCHTNYTAFKPAFMNHTGTAAQCSTCHNGTYIFAHADKQGATHIPDSRQCDVCHTSTVVWTQRLMVHPATAPGNCSSCHSGQYLSENAQMKPATHVATSAQCDSCHKSMVTWANATYAHDATAIGVCSNCHKAGGPGLSKPANHVPTAKQCDTCHTNYVAFKPAQMNHTGLAGQCSTCHNATYAFANANPQGTTHIPTTAQCDSCHTSTVGWASRAMNHTVVAATSCTTCHSGAYLTENAQTKSASHIPIGTIQCSACHKSFTAFSPATMDHTTVVATPCATCHGGAYVAANAQTKPATHLVTALACNASGCHTGTITWAGLAYAHQAADQTTCSNCHKAGGPGLAKPTPHIPTTAQCSICHNMPSIGSNTYSTRFKPIKTPMDHVTSGASVTVCSTCHNATYAFANANPQGVTHIPTTSNCLVCHKTGFVNWTVPLANMDHTGMAGKCSTCHAGGYLTQNAQAKGTTHIPTTQQCDYCHTGGYLAWTTLPRMNHTGLTGQCATCHSGGYLSENAQMKSGGHIPTTAQCDSCHTSTTIWTTVKHITVGIAKQCSTCHNGAYVSVNALATPANHIPYQSQLLAGATLNCDSCHTGYVSWVTGQKMNHNGSQGNGSGFCKGCHQTGLNYLGSMEKKSLTHDKTGKTDCSVAGCHRPLGTRGTAYTKW